MAANMIEVDASTFFDKALANYARLEKIVDYHWNKAKDAYIDNHLHDTWGMFGRKGYSSRQDCFDSIAYKSGAGWTKKGCLIKLGYLPADLDDHIEPFEIGVNVPYKKEMESLKRTGGKCTIKHAMLEYVHKAEDLDEILEKYESNLEEAA